MDFTTVQEEDKEQAGIAGQSTQDDGSTGTTAGTTQGDQTQQDNLAITNPSPDAMPSFSFDEADFGGIAQTDNSLMWTQESEVNHDQSMLAEPQVVEPQSDSDPFHGGVTSTNISLDDLSTGEFISVPQDFSLPVTEAPLESENQTPLVDNNQEFISIEKNDTIIDSEQDTTLSFDDNHSEENQIIDPSSEIQESMSEEISPEIIQEDAQTLSSEPVDSLQDISSDLPEFDLDEMWQDVSSQQEATQGENDVPTFDFSEETSEEAKKEEQSLVIDEENSPQEETPSDGIVDPFADEAVADEAVVEEDNVPEEVEEDNVPEEVADEAVVEEEATGGNTGHEISDDVEELSHALSTYLDFLGSNSVSIIGLRTDDEEVYYSFTLDSDESIVIEKSTTGDTITLLPSESSVEVMLNEEIIADYGNENVEDDITHYLKEKLGKFTAMIKGDYEKENKAQKEKNKKIKKVLRSF